MIMQLMVRCKICGNTHPSGYQMDQTNFNNMGVMSNFETCPRCSQMYPATKPDYRFQ